jgi:hypothetical protein
MANVVNAMNDTIESLEYAVPEKDRRRILRNAREVIAKAKGA